MDADGVDFVFQKVSEFLSFQAIYQMQADISCHQLSFPFLLPIPDEYSSKVV